MLIINKYYVLFVSKFIHNSLWDHSFISGTHTWTSIIVCLPSQDYVAKMNLLNAYVLDIVLSALPAMWSGYHY